MGTTGEKAEEALNSKLEGMKEALRLKNKPPIFFIGSGLSRRYLKSPDWKGLLEQIAEEAGGNYEELSKQCNGGLEEIAQELEYYCFRNADENKLGQRRGILREFIANVFKECVEGYHEEEVLEESEGINQEIKELLMEMESVGSKVILSNIESYITKYGNISEKTKGYSNNLENLMEIRELQGITPKAIITTNYDTLLEDIVFKGKYNRYIGQEGFSHELSNSEDENGILNLEDGSRFSNSENKIDLYKIHGCVSKPDSILITKEDYDNFFQKGKYLYSKIFTLFWEYPIIFIGYSVSDRNIKDILTVMVEIMTEKEKKEFEKNIWVVDYAANGEEGVTDKEIELLNGKKITVTCFCLKHYLKLYRAIKETISSQRFGELHFDISKNVIELLIEPLYQQQDKLKVVVRELLQNALDACKKKKVDAAIAIRIFEKDGNCYLEIKDNGIGMDLREVKENFLTVGKTSKKGNCEGLIGKYGIGILSIFLIGERAEVYTRKEGGELLPLEIFIKKDEKQVGWIKPENMDEDLVRGSKSFTVVKVQLNKSLELEDGKVSEALGLEPYVAKPGNSISVIYKGKKVYDVPMMDKPEWFLDVSEEAGSEGVKVQLSQLEYIDLEEELEGKENRLKDLISQNNMILYNDMVSAVKYEISAYRQLRGVNIPFVALDVKKETEEDVVTDLSRSALQVSGKVMQAIARGIYQLEIDKIMEVLCMSQEEAGDNRQDIFGLLKKLRDSSVIMQRKVDILLHKDKIFFSQISPYPHVNVFGQEKMAKEFIKTAPEPVLYKDDRINKTDVSDLIEGECLICISENYIGDYLWNATNQHNGLRKNAARMILDVLEIPIELKQPITGVWNDIKAKRQEIMAAFDEKASNGILWLKEEYEDVHLDAEGKYFIAFKSWQVSQYLDQDFCEILQQAIKEKEVGNLVEIVSQKG